MSSKVWDRSGTSTLSRGKFSALLTGFTTVGILFSLACSTVTKSVDMTSWSLVQWLIAIVAVLGVGFLGIWISAANDNPWLSGLGLALVSGSMGLFLGPAVGQYDPNLVLSVGLETTALVVVLGLVGALVPKNLAGWGNWLFGALIILIIGLLSVPVMGALGLSTAGAFLFWNWAGIVIFGLLVIYDLNRAMRVPYTVRNAIDCSIALFLDWINLFIRLLALRSD